MLRMRFLHEKALVRIGTYSSNSLLSQKQAIRLAALALCEGLGANKSGIARPNTDAFDRLLLGLLPITHTKGCDQPTGPGTPGGAHSKPGTPDSMQSPASTADSVDSIGTPKQASKMKRRRAKLAALVWKEYQLVADGVIAGSGTAEMAMHAYLRHLEDRLFDLAREDPMQVANLSTFLLACFDCQCRFLPKSHRRKKATRQ